MDQNAEYLWLKQSVTFTVNGQTRTVEIALPVRPGATVDEVEALLSEADAGMERLSRHLDARVAAIGGLPAPAAQPVVPEPEPAPERPQPASEAEPPRQPTAPAARHQPEAVAAPQPRSPAASAPTRPTPITSTAPITPATSPAASRPAPAPSAITSNRSPQQAPTGPQGELSRPDFIAALRDLDLDVRQAMQKLNVRSLEGLNLREALEALRRQTLRSGQAEPQPMASAPKTPTPASSRAAPVREEPPHYFEEEDEPDMTFSVADEDEPEDEPLSAYGEPDAWDDDSDDLDEVPDFGPPPTSSRRTAAAKPAPTPLPARPTRGPSSGALVAPAEPVSPADAEGSRASQLLGRLRSAQGGGSPTSQQRTAYRNIVVQEIGETKATGLVRGIWRVTPERLGPEQMDELLSWGKQDTFSDDAELVLAELRAERERAAAASSENGATKPAPRPRTRPLSATDPSGGA